MWPQSFTLELAGKLNGFGQRLQQEAATVLKAPAIGIVALIGVRRERALAEMAMGKVQLQSFIADLARTDRRRHEIPLLWPADLRIG